MSEKKVHLEGVGLIAITRNVRSLNIRISVKSDGKVRVTIPWTTPFSAGEKFLQAKKDWIIKTIAKLAKRVPSKTLIADGELFATRSYQYNIASAPVEIPRIRFSETEKTVVFEYPEKENLSSEPLQSQIKTLIENVLRFEAKRYLPKHTRQIALEMGFNVNRIVIKNNKTNWGSCSNKKNINLNLHLMRLPDRLIDFIIVHELVHTIIPNHGPFFKAEMRKHFHDADLLDKEIKKFKTAIF